MSKNSLDDRATQDELREIEIRDQEASQYDQWIAQTRGLWWFEVEKEAILSYLNPSPTDIILDCGCGTGRFSFVVAPLVQQVFCVDHSKKSLEFLSEKAEKGNVRNLLLSHASIEVMDFIPSASVDHAMMVGVLQHLTSHQKRINALKECWRVLKPGGRLVLDVYRWWGESIHKKEGYFDSGLYYFRFTPEELRDNLTEAEFRVKGVRGILNHQGLRRFGDWTSRIDRVISLLPRSERRGIYLCACGVKPLDRLGDNENP